MNTITLHLSEYRVISLQDVSRRICGIERRAIYDGWTAAKEKAIARLWHLTTASA